MPSVLTPYTTLGGLNAISADTIHHIVCGFNAVSADSIHLIECGFNAISADSIHRVGCGLNFISADTLYFIFWTQNNLLITVNIVIYRKIMLGKTLTSWDHIAYTINIISWV